MEMLSDIAPYVALGAAVLSVVLLVLVIVLLTRVSRLRRAQSVVLGHHEQRDIVEHTEDLDAQVRNLREAVELLTDQLDDQRRHMDHALTNRAIVRYDAFRDAGGEQSASFALLDQYRSGVVFSAIAARDFARIYVKHVTDGVADRDLSPEEAQAMQLAVPRPLAAGEEGPKARRAPLPEARPPAGLAAQAPAERAAGAAVPDDTATAAERSGAAAERPDAATAAFEALGDAVAPDADADPTLGDDFAWEPPPQGPQGGPPSRR
jgi:hypothetical protein